MKYVIHPKIVHFFTSYSQCCNPEVGQKREALAELHTLSEQGTSELIFETRWKGGGAKLK